ncbi:MAG: hypothetical protein KDD45_08035 [Bdellovibrionales bacterium]|nr:hypothetical protein [Bdellovibrionales bacterium]
MTLLALLAIAAFTLYNFNAEEKVANEEFELWKNKYSKKYSPREEAYRIGIWLKNLEFVESHN